MQWINMRGIKFMIVKKFKGKGQKYYLINFTTQGIP
jgi:hypothetical protein